MLFDVIEIAGKNVLERARRTMEIKWKREAMREDRVQCAKEASKVCVFVIYNIADRLLCLSIYSKAQIL